MAKRITIPPRLRLDMLIEAGYRCAVPTCRTILTLELHHIDPVREDGMNVPDNLIVLCPNCHTMLEKGIISPEAINVYKTMLVSLGHAFDKESISNLLFLRNIWSQIDQGRSKKGILKYLNEHKGVGYEKTMEDLNILIISGDGVLKFAHLISAGLAGFKFCHSAPETMAKIVFHLVPFGAFELTSRYDLSTLALPDNRALIMPLVMEMNDSQMRNYCRHRYNFDGLLNHAQWANDLSVATYLQVFRNGIVEGVDASILNMDRFPKQIPSIHFEQVLCYALSVYLQTQKTLGVDLPIFALVSLLGVKDYKMVYVGQWPQGQQDYPIDRPDLVIPEVMIDSFDCDPAEVMKPIFDTVWNAAGWKGSMHFDAAGKWKLQKLG